MALPAKILDQQHPDYNAEAMGRRRALYEGGETTRARMRSMLPKMPHEPGERWADRIARATYANHAGPIVSFRASYVFSEPPVVEVEGTGADWYAGTEGEPGFVGNVDRQQTSWPAFWRDRLDGAAVNQCEYIWACLPDSGDAERGNLAEQEQAGDLNAYLVGLSAEEVIDWGEDEAGRLAWIMVKHEIDARAGIEVARKRTIRWTYVDADKIRIWEWTEKEGRKTPAPEDDIKERPEIVHGFGKLPVVRLTLPRGLWMMEVLHDPAMALFHAENDIDWAAYLTAHSIMWLRSVWEEQPPALADGYFLQLHRDKDGDDEVGWLEISGSSHEVLRKRAQDLEQELYRVANSLALAGDEGAAAAARSGESKAMDYQAVAIVAKEYAKLLLSAMRQTIRMVSDLRNDNVNPKVGGLEGYDAAGAADFLDVAAMAKPLVKSETFAREIAKRAVNAALGDSVDDETTATIYAEIEAADYTVETVAPFTPPPLPKEGDGEEDVDDDDTDGGQ